MSWHNWEDYQAGMYRAEPLDEQRVQDAAKLLTDPDEFHEAAWEMVRSWPNAARHNLMYLWTGRNAWIGQATCCYSVGATGAETRAAWGSLTNDQHDTANHVATRVRLTWERGYRDNAQTRLAL